MYVVEHWEVDFTISRCSYCCLLWEAVGGAPPSACIYIPSRYWQSINARAESGADTHKERAPLEQIKWAGLTKRVLFSLALKEQSAHTHRGAVGGVHNKKSDPQNPNSPQLSLDSTKQAAHRSISDVCAETWAGFFREFQQRMNIISEVALVGLWEAIWI